MTKTIYKNRTLVISMGRRRCRWRRRRRRPSRRARPSQTWVIKPAIQHVCRFNYPEYMGNSSTPRRGRVGGTRTKTVNALSLLNQCKSSNNIDEANADDSSTLAIINKCKNTEILRSLRQIMRNTGIMRSLSASRPFYNNGAGNDDECRHNKLCVPTAQENAQKSRLYEHNNAARSPSPENPV